MAEVMLARELRTGRAVAIKRSLAGEVAEAMLAREGRILARLGHPGVIGLDEVITHAGRTHLVLEYVAGERGARAGRRRLAALRGRMIALFQALAHIHARGVYHLDLKRENVLVDPHGLPRLIDFGIAGCAGDPPPVGPDVVLGTPRAMAPEQLLGDPVDARADLFALGALLYELCSGHAPFAAGSIAETVDRVLVHTPPPVRSVAPAVPLALAALIDELLEKDPARRPASAAEVLARLA